MKDLYFQIIGDGLKTSINLIIIGNLNFHKITVAIKFNILPNSIAIIFEFF